MDRKYIRTILIVIVLIFVVGCAGKNKALLRASDSMFAGNHIEKIAVISDGSVVWGKLFYIEGRPILGVRESKVALEKLVPQFQEELKYMGYNVVFSEAVRVGYFEKTDKKSRVYDNYSEEGKETKSWEIAANEAAYEYPVVVDNPEFGNAIRNVYKQMGDQILWRYPYDLKAQQEDLAVLREFTGADTICFNRLWGALYTSGTKVSSFFMGGRAKESIGTFFNCVDATSGEVLWQMNFSIYANPLDPPDWFAEGALDFFPMANGSIKQECKKTRHANIYECIVKE